MIPQLVSAVVRAAVTLAMDVSRLGWPGCPGCTRLRQELATVRGLAEFHRRRLEDMTPSDPDEYIVYLMMVEKHARRAVAPAEDPVAGAEAWCALHSLLTAKTT